MKVSQILSEKGTHVYVVPEVATMATAIDEMRSHNIGVVVVVDAEQKLTGILSERDIIRSLATASVENADILSQTVSHFMTHKVHTCTRNSDISDVMTLMSENRFRHLPVVEEGRLVGIISIGDVVKRKIQEAEEEAAVLKQYIMAS